MIIVMKYNATRDDIKSVSLEIEKTSLSTHISEGSPVTIMADPCAIESQDQLLESATSVQAGGTTTSKGGAYKPRTSTYALQGLEEEGLKYMKEAKVHPNPKLALSDGPQSLYPLEFKDLMEELKPTALASGRTL